MPTLNFEFGIPAGQSGADGQTGASAYDAWIAAGNQGTQQDFLDSLVVNVTATATVTALPAGSTPTVTVTAS